MFFRCKHPLSKLVVERPETRTQKDEDFDRVEYHFVCRGCGESVSLRYVSMRGGVEGFLERGVAQARRARDLVPTEASSSSPPSGRSGPRG